MRKVLARKDPMQPGAPAGSQPAGACLDRNGRPGGLTQPLSSGGRRAQERLAPAIALEPMRRQAG